MDENETWIFDPNVEYYPTTIDNPWNPFIDWGSWNNWDCKHGYNTLQRMDRLTETMSQALPDKYNNESWNLGIKKLCDLFPFYIRVTKDSKIRPISIDLLESLSFGEQKDA